MAQGLKLVRRGVRMLAGLRRVVQAAHLAKPQVQPKQPLEWVVFVVPGIKGFYQRTKLSAPRDEQYEVFCDADGGVIMHYPKGLGMAADIYPDVATAKAAAEALYEL